MARKRMIDPQFFLDEELAALTPHARLLYIGLWTIADDTNATLPDRPKWIKAQVFPYEDMDIEGVLDELSTSTHIRLFTASDDHKYWFLPSFHKYQRIDRPSKPKYPEYVGKFVEGSTSTLPEVKLSKVKLSEREGITTLNEKVCGDIAEKYSVSLKAVRKTRDALMLWCRKNGKVFSDYPAALEDWVRQDIDSKKIAKITPSTPMPNLPEPTPAEKAATHKKIQDIRSKLRVKSV